jgi:hypothetical protein
MDIPSDIHRLEGDLLRLAYSIFFGDPAPGVSHVSHYNMLTDGQSWALVSFIFIVGALAAWHLYRTFRVRAA